MKKLISVSIGIPAYNESANIKNLLKSLLGQKQGHFTLKEVFVASDGSTDGTDGIVQAFHDKRIHLLSDGKRLGKSSRLNQMLQTFTGDILFLMDADILITETNLLDTIVKSTDFKKVGLIGVNATPLPGATFFENTVNAGVAMMKDIARFWRSGDNFLSYKGCFLGLEKNFAKSVSLPKSLVNNDAFFYFAAKEHGYNPKYLAEAVVYYRSPASYADHSNQSSRYQDSQTELQKYFKLDLPAEYHMPLSAVARAMGQNTLRNPVYSLSYFLLRVITKVKKQKQTSRWQIASSTKGVSV